MVLALVNNNYFVASLICATKQTFNEESQIIAKYFESRVYLFESKVL